MSSTPLKTQSVYHSAAATAPANPTRVGYNFAGWNKAFNVIRANTDVSATWTLKKVTYQYDPNGGTGTMKYGNKETISVAPWITDGDRTVTLYAIWEKKNANFNLENIEKDEEMFTGSKKLKGGNGTKYREDKTDSEYAVQDEKGKGGYFSRK